MTCRGLPHCGRWLGRRPTVCGVLTRAGSFSRDLVYLRRGGCPPPSGGPLPPRLQPSTPSLASSRRVKVPRLWISPTRDWASVWVWATLGYFSHQFRKCAVMCRKKNDDGAKIRGVTVGQPGSFMRTMSLVKSKIQFRLHYLFFVEEKLLSSVCQVTPRSPHQGGPRTEGKKKQGKRANRKQGKKGKKNCQNVDFWTQNSP